MVVQQKVVDRGTSVSDSGKVRRRRSENDGNGCNGVSLVSVTGCARTYSKLSTRIISFPLSLSRWRATFVFAARRSFARVRSRRGTEERAHAVSRNNKCRSISGIHQPRAPRESRRQTDKDERGSVRARKGVWTEKRSDGAS